MNIKKNIIVSFLSVYIFTVFCTDTVSSGWVSLPTELKQHIWSIVFEHQCQKIHSKRITQYELVETIGFAVQFEGSKLLAAVDIRRFCCKPSLTELLSTDQNVFTWSIINCFDTKKRDNLASLFAKMRHECMGGAFGYTFSLPHNKECMFSLGSNMDSYTLKCQEGKVVFVIEKRGDITSKKPDTFFTIEPHDTSEPVTESKGLVLLPHDSLSYMMNMHRIWMPCAAALSSMVASAADLPEKKYFYDSVQMKVYCLMMESHFKRGCTVRVYSLKPYIIQNFMQALVLYSSGHYG